MKRPTRKALRSKTVPLNNKTVSKRRAGRPEHEPTKWHREKVETFASVGYNAAQIAGYLKISEDTLFKHYRRELAYATMDMLSLAKEGLAEALRHKKPWAVCFVLKTRGKALYNGVGWSERQEITGANGKDLIPELDITKLSDDQLIKLREAQRLLASIVATPSDRPGDQEEEN